MKSKGLKDRLGITGQIHKIEPDESASLLGETMEMEGEDDDWNQHYTQRNNNIIPNLLKTKDSAINIKEKHDKNKTRNNKEK